jgi:hypothetical protein
MNADGGQWPSVRGIWPNWMAAYGAAAACMLALPVAAANAAQAETIVPIVPIVPSTTPPPELSLGEQLERTIRNMIELIARPDPRYATFVSISSKTRVIAIETKIDGKGNTMMIDSKPLVAELLTKLFTPQDGVQFSWGKPQTMIDGAFGRVLIELTITEEKRRPEKHRIYFDAVREKIRLVDLHANRDHLAPSLVEGRRIGAELSACSIVPRCHPFPAPYEQTGSQHKGNGNRRCIRRKHSGKIEEPE